jgi:hypothetical protein
MAAEVGDWVRTKLGLEGVVKEVRGDTATIDILKGFGATIRVPVKELRVTTKPQTGVGR